MSIPVNYYRYVISDRLGTLQVAPLGESDFTIQWNREDEGKLDYQKKMGGKIVFIGAAYQNMLKLETSIYRCDYVTITIDRKCVSGGIETWVPWHTGRMSFNDGTWDLDSCQVEIKIDDVQPDQCFDSNKNKEINLFQNTSTRVTVSLAEAGIVLEKVIYTRMLTYGDPDCSNLVWNGTGTPASQGYIDYYYQSTQDGVVCEMETRWAREIKMVNCADPAPDGIEWVLIENLCPSGQKKYARPARTYGCKFSASDFGSNPEVNTQSCKLLGDTSMLTTVDNGMLLSEIITTYLTNFCPSLTFVSNFFQINPNVPSAINYVTGQKTKTAHIIVFQKSDVKRPNVSNNATQANISWEKLFDALVKMFNVRWRIEGTILRMEHVSYFLSVPGFDLTIPKYARDMIGKRKYTYNIGEIPQQEVFSFMEASYGDFKGLPITYSGGCVTATSRDNTKNYAVENVTTDVELCLANPDSDSKVVDDKGFVFMACDLYGLNYYLITELPILGGSTLNNSLAWAQLHRDYYKWDRPLLNGNLNGLNTTFNSVKPSKRGEAIRIKYCCDDPAFNPDNTITTFLGTGIVDKATFSFKDETLQLELLYPADLGLVSNSAPVAVNDVVTGFKNILLHINVLVNDTDIDAGDFITLVEIVVPPIHGTATVQPDNSILYTPSLDYSGTDAIVYRIYDEWNEVSNNALISITIMVNQPPVAGNDNFVAYKNDQIIGTAPGLFSNDSDDVSFTLSAYDNRSLQGGSVIVNADGSFSYTPVGGFTGTDSFTYTIIDELGLTSTGTVTIEVRDPANPVAVDDSYNATLNTSLSISAPGVLANDTSPDTLTAQAGTFVTAQGGGVEVRADGSFNYNTPTGYTGIDSFDYVALSTGGSDSGHVSITIRPFVYVRLQKVDVIHDIINFDCGTGLTDRGNKESAIFRLFFYSDSAGTIPLNTTGFGLNVNFNITGGIYGSSQTYTTNYNVTPTGVSYDILFGRYEYFHFENACDNSVVYKNENITLLPGSYTII